MFVTARRFPSASLLFAVAAVLLHVVPGAWEAFQWDRSRPGEVWRGVTSHWTHWSMDHLCWDVIAFVVLGAACEWRDRRRFLVTVGVSALLITPAVWLFNPGIEYYRGLSGIDSALFGLLATTMAREHIAGRRWGQLSLLALVATGFVAKISFETTSGLTVFVNSAQAGFVPAALAHFVGLVVGLTVALIGERPCLTRLRWPLKLLRKCFRSRLWLSPRSPAS